MAKSKVITASQVISPAGVGKVYGFIVSSHTNGTLKLWDSDSASGNVIMDTFTVPSGSGIFVFPHGSNENAGVEFYNGLYATVGGTATITILWGPR